MPGAADWQNIPTDVLDQVDMQQKADDWAKDQYAKLAQDWADTQHTTPMPGSGITRPDVSLGAAPSEPAAGASPVQEPSAATPSLPPDAAPAPAASTTAGQFSPYDATFRKYAGEFANDPEFIKIVAAGTLAESSWNPNSTSGDGGHSWGLFQMHDRGSGAGMGSSRLDPDAASAKMVPLYARAYDQLKDKVSGPALAAAVAQAAERSADPSGRAYARAYQQLSSTGAPDIVSSAKNWLSGLGGAVGGAASALGGALNTAATGAGLQQTNQNLSLAAQPISSLGTGGTPDDRQQSFFAAMRGSGEWTPQAIAGAVEYGLPMVAGLVGPGGDVQAAKAGAGILKDALEQLKSYPSDTRQPIEEFVSQAQKLGQSDSSIGATIQRWVGENPPPKSAEELQLAAPEMTRLEPEIQAALPQGPAKPTEEDLMSQWRTQLENMRATRGYQEAAPSAQTNMVAQAQGDFQAERAAGGAGQGSPPTLPAPPEAPLPSGGGPSGKGLPPAAMQALREYAAAVGPQSNAALVQAQQDVRAAGQIGEQVNVGGLAGSNKAQAREVLDQKLGDLGLQGNPQVQQFIKNVETPSSVPDMPILGGLQRAQNEIKGVIFPLSMFHAYTEGLYSTFSRPGGAGEFAAAFLSKSPTEAAQQTPMWVRAARAGVTHLYDTNAFDAPGTASGLQGAAIRAGIGGAGGAGAGYADTKIGGGDDEQARQNALIYGLVGAAGAAAAKPLISDNLWRAVQYSKVKTFETLVKSSVDDQVAASAVNRTFGGLNYAQMGRNQTFQDLLRLTVQAPDWQESTARQLGSAFFGHDAGANFSRGVLARTVLGSALATQVLNQIFTGHWSWDNEPGHQFEVQLPSGTADKPVYIGIGPGNLQQYADLTAKVAKEPDKALIREYRGQREMGDIPQAIVNRMAAVPRMGAEAAGIMPAFGGGKAPLPAEVAAQAAPISISTAVQAQQQNMSPAAEALLLASGMNPRYGSAQNEGRAVRPIRSSEREVRPRR